MSDCLIARNPVVLMGIHCCRWRAPRKWLLRVLLAGAAAGLLVLGSLGMTAATAGRTPAVAANTSTLDLMARPEAGHLVVSWNWQAEQLKSADRATLLVTDSGHRDAVELDLGVLRGRRLAYSPLSNDVTFQLTVSHSGQSAAVTESVRVLTPLGYR